MPLTDSLLEEDDTDIQAAPKPRLRTGKRKNWSITPEALDHLDSLANMAATRTPAAAEQPKPKESIGILGTLKEGAKGTLRALGATVDTAQGDEAGVVQAAKEQATAEKDPDLADFYAHIDERKKALTDPSLWEGIKAVGSAALKNPRGFGLMIAEQAPNSVAALGAGGVGALAGSAFGPIGTVIGGIGGLATANIGLETGNKALEAGADGSFGRAEQSQVRKEGLIKGSVITGVDALTLGATKWITGTTRRAVERATTKTLSDAGVDVTNAAARKAALTDPVIKESVTKAQDLAKQASDKLGKRLARTAGAVGLETVGEGAGEYLGEFAATGKANTIDAVIEAFAGFGQSAGEIALTSALNRQGMKRLFDNPEEAEKAAKNETKKTDVPHEAMPAPGNPDKYVAVPKTRSASGIEFERDAEGNLTPVSAPSTQADFNLANKPGFQHTAEDKIREQEQEKARNAAYAANPIIVPGSTTKTPVIAGKPVTDMSNNALIYTVSRGSARAQKIANDELARRDKQGIDPTSDNAPETPVDTVNRIIATGAERAKEEAKKIQPILAPAPKPVKAATAPKSNPQPTPEPKKVVNTSQVVLPDNTSLPAHWDVVDADSVKATIKEGKNQPRDRSRAASDIQVQGIANNPDYRRLADSPVMDVGAPTLSHDGLIVGGNGRFEGISRAYDQGSANNYLTQLKTDATAKGIDPARLEGMKKPVLVRRITQPFDVRKLAIASNSGSGLQYSGMELAKIDAERIKGLEHLDVTDTGDIALTGSNIQNVRHALGGYSAAELGSLTDKNGQLSQEGVRRIRNAMLYSAYGSNPTLERLVESTDNDLRNISGALVKAAGSAAKVRADIKAGNLPTELDISESIVGAVETLSKIKSQGMTVDEYLAQNGLFGEEINEDTREILRVLEANIRSQRKIAEFIRTYYETVSRIDISTNDIFGANIPTKPELLKNAKAKITETAPETSDLFAKPTAKPSQESSKQPSDNARPKDSRAQDQVKPAPAPKPKDEGTGGAAPKTHTAKPNAGADSGSKQAENTTNSAHDIRPHIDALIKRRAAARQIGKERTFDKALTDAKAMLAGEKVSPARFKNAAKLFANDKATADILTALQTKAEEANKAVKPTSKAKKPTIRETLESHFQPGNIISTNNRRTHDRVISFDWNNGSWHVTVEEVKKDSSGHWQSVEKRVRNHSTLPDARDKVIERAANPSFSRSKTPAPKSQSRARVESVINSIKAKWKNAPEVVVIDNISAAPADVQEENNRQLSMGASGEPEGFISGNKVYIVASQMKTPGDVVRVLLHESLGHFGLRGVFGAELQTILRQVAAMRPRDIEAKAKQYGLDLSKEEDRLTAAEEILSEMAQTNPQSGVVRRAIAAIHKWLRNHIPGFGKLMLSDSEIIQDILIPARQFVEQGAKAAPAQGVMFSRSPAAIKSAIRDRIDKISDSLIYNFQDRFKPLKDIQERSGPVAEDEDAALAEERYSGMVRARTDNFQEQLRDPLVKAIHDSGVSYEDTEAYLHALHAPSRNAAMREINPTATELTSQTSALEKQRDSLAKDPDVTQYLKLRRELRDAEADIEDGIADESLAVAIKRDIAQVKKVQNVTDYTDALDKLKALRLVKPFQGDNTALSGMSDAEAKAILDKIDANGTRKALERISALVDDITSKTRQIYIDSGLEKANVIDAWNKKYEHYVPLHRDEVSGNTMPRIGQGFNIKGKESKRATGSTKDVTNILAHVVAQHEAAIIRSEKAKVDRALFAFAQRNPDPSLWTLDEAPMLRTVDPNSGLVVERVDPTYKNRPEVLTLKIDGEEHTITFNDKNEEAMRLAASMKNLGADQLGEVTQMVGKITRFLAMMNTTANPVFTARNFLRDLQTAYVNLSDTAVADKKAAVFRDVRSAIRGMWDLSRGKKTSQWAKYAQEFKDAGGQTGWMEHYKDIGERADKIKKELEAMKPGKMNLAMRTAREWGRVISDANNAVENGVRLSAYVQARKSGLSEAKAAQLAKNLTVNFNARGAQSVQLNSWYMFMNASIQGTARLAKALSNKEVRKIVAGVILSGFLMDILARSMAGDDDDDGENDYDQLPEHVKAMNFVFMVNNRPVTIPMPYGYNFFASTGRKISEIMFRPHYSPVKSAADLTGVFLDAFSPTGQAGSFLQYISPTVTDPLVQWSENKNFAGNPLRRPQSPFGVPNPEYQMGFKSTSAPAKWLAEMLNNETGGNEVRPGFVNVNPAFFDFAVSSIAGGAGRTYLQTLSGPMKSTQGEDIKAKEVPFLNIFLGAKPEYQTEKKYFEAVRAVETAKDELKTYRAKGDAEMVKQILEDHGHEIRLQGAAKETKNLLARLKKRDLALDKTNPPNKRELRKQIEDQRREAMARLNKKYRQAVEAH